ncbi:MAG: ATP synthase subunit I [Deltaproteobacteria bacterium]|nr:ATP synthase subunit I [Deltaproteobacteria bacterium]
MMILAAAFAAGLILGAFYFAALWETVRRLSCAASPVKLMLGSLGLRMAVLTTGFYFIMGGHWERLALALLGFVVMRKILTYRLGPQNTAQAARS